MNGELIYIADCIIIEELAKNDLSKNAQEGGITSTITSYLKDFIASNYSSEHPIASVMSFLGPGLLLALPFGGWLSVIYTVAEALGFNWTGFWASLGNGVSSLLKNILSMRETNPEYQAPQDQISQQVSNLVSSTFDAHFTGEEDTSKLMDIAKSNNISESKISENSLKRDIKNALQVKSVGLHLQKDPIIKKAFIGLLFRGKLKQFFVRLLSWFVKTIFISLGFTTGAAIVGGVLGTTKKKDQEEIQSETPIAKEQLKAPQLKMSPSVPRSLFDTHRNDEGSVWIEKGNIEDIEDYLLNWTLSAYPNLDKEKLKSSSGFQSIISKFRARNSLSSGVGLIAFPKPFERKIDVVSVIVNGYHS